MGISGPFGHDVRFGFRSLLQARGFAVTAILSLALGIAATTTIFSVIYGVIIDPFPYAHPETLMSVLVREPDRNLVFSPSHQSSIWTSPNATKYSTAPTGPSPPPSAM